MADNKSKVYIGVDGCRGGWIAAVLINGELRLEHFDSINSIVGKYPDFNAFLIDMVIGLRSSSTQIRPDDLVRKELKGHSSTVFPAPCRQAVYADTEEAMKQANILALGKSLPQQTISIIPKIREIDEFLEHNNKYRNRILESHPEIAFARLKGDALDSKKYNYPGYLERLHILERYLPECTLFDFRNKAKELRCNLDDLLDAVCLVVTASMSEEGLCETIPSEPELDDKGLYMQLTVPKNECITMMTEKKVAVVTGGANGIGKAITAEFRKNGVKVYVIDIFPEGNHTVGDISEKNVLEEFAAKIIRECGRIDYLVNNAPPIMKGIDECSYEEFQYAMSVGVTAPFYLSKLFAP